jgi:hypothetical protein
MKFSIRDGLASLAVAAILVPYIGFLTNGSMPFIKDPRGMSATVLVLGAVAFLFAGQFSTATPIGITEIVLMAASLALGVAAVLAAETAAAYTLLAFAVGAVVVTWAVQLLHHIGMVHTGPLAAH